MLKKKKNKEKKRKCPGENRGKKKQPKTFPPSFSVYNVQGDGAHKQGWPVRLDEELELFSLSALK